MKTNRTARMVPLAAFGVAVMGVASCGDLENDTAGVQGAAIGDRNQGVAAADFAEVSAAFSAFENINDGVGPIFNNQACGQCHTDGANGGAGVQIERRFGQFTNGTFRDLAGNGGSLRQLFTVANFNNNALPAASRGRCQPGNPTLCCVPQEQEPSAATVHNVGRLTTPLFGLGLVDALTDAQINAVVAAEPGTVRGFINRVPQLLGNPSDPNQNVGTLRNGRFGWKAGVGNLQQFSADAYVNEMAITTQSCIRGQTINAFAIESAPNGIPVADGCDDLAPRQTGTNPGGLSPSQWAQVDDAIGSCAGGLTEIQDDILEFAEFMAALAPPPRGNIDATVTAGQPLFTSVGCAGCHTTNTYRTPADAAAVGDIAVPRNFAFQPFSDFAVHDMGTLGDQIGNTGDSLEVTRRMRTAPLWGIRFRNKLLHDGRTGDIISAIRAHDGQGAAARNAFNALTGAQQSNLAAYVRSL